MKFHILFLTLFALFANGCSTHLIRSVHDERISDSLGRARFVPITFEEQIEDYCCGPAVLISVLRYWNISEDQAHLVELYPPQSVDSGYTLGELKNIAREQGLYAFAIKGDLPAIKEHLVKGRPIIVPIKVDSDYIIEETLPFLGPISRNITKLLTPSYHHYATVFGYDKEILWLMDPVLGIKSVDIDDFLKMWTAEQNAMLLVSR